MWVRTGSRSAIELSARQSALIDVVRSLAMDLTAVLTPAEEGGFVALNPETGTMTQGETVEEAVANLKEATVLYLSEFRSSRRKLRSPTQVA